jgi:hypothetical protein
MKSVILQYIEGLQLGDLNKIIDLFAEDGLVHSPLYGDLLAKDFYTDLFSDTLHSKIVLLNIFTSVDKPNTYGAHFKYEWTLRNSIGTTFECVDIFVFDEIGKIKEMTIIYDTYRTRQSFDNR